MMLFHQLDVLGRLVARTAVGGVALNDGAVYGLDHRLPELGRQKVLVARFAGVNLDGDLTGQLEKNLVGKDIKNYDSMLVLSHFKGHPMGGFGGALKQLSIGCASSAGKANIHGGIVGRVDEVEARLVDGDGVKGFGSREYELIEL